LATARRLLEAEGPGAVTMRRIADEMGIRAPSLYKHYPDKRSLEAALKAEGLREFGAALSSALAKAGSPIGAIAGAYRSYALEHPHLYRLTNDDELPRDLLPPGLEESVAAPLIAVFGSRDKTRVAWALAHGLVSLELSRRFPPDADLARVWQAAVRALEAMTTKELGAARRG